MGRQRFPQYGGGSGSVAKQGIKCVGLNATPTGSTAVTVANFLGATTTPIGNATLLPLSEWLTVTDSAVNGTLLTILRPGLYEIEFMVAATGANRVQSGILQGAVIPANPVYSATGVIAVADYLAAAGGQDAKTITKNLLLSAADIATGTANQVRFLLSNAAGAAPTTAGVVVANCGYAITKLQHVQSVA